MNFENTTQPTIIDKKTDREVLTKPPYPSFKWKEGYVLRAITKEESQIPSQDYERAQIGGDRFDWVPSSEVEIDQ